MGIIEKLPKDFEGDVDWGCVLFMLGLMFLVGGTLLILVDSYAYGPLRAEAALNYCENKGHDNYLDYSWLPLDDKVYGVRCMNPDSFLLINEIGD